MTNTKTLIAVVRNSPLGGPEIAITDDSGYVVLWLDVPGHSVTLTELTERLRKSDFEVLGEWRTIFSSHSLCLTIEVRNDREFG